MRSDQDNAAAQRRDAALAHLHELGLQLPKPPPSKGSYVGVRRHGELLWISGHTARGPQGLRVTGVVGVDVSVADAEIEARGAAVNLLGAADGSGLLPHGLGDIVGVMALRTYVRAAGDFGDHPRVANAASDLLHQVLGAKVGQHARAAIGVASLPGGAAVELEAVLACSL